MRCVSSRRWGELRTEPRAVPEAVPVGARVRALFAVKETAEAVRDGVQVTWSVTMQVERPDVPLPVCAAEFITLHYF